MVKNALAVLQSPVLSHIWYVTVSLPAKEPFGRYTNIPFDLYPDPLLGCTVTANVDLLISLFGS